MVISVTVIATLKPSSVAQWRFTARIVTIVLSSRIISTILVYKIEATYL